MILNNITLRGVMKISLGITSNILRRNEKKKYPPLKKLKYRFLLLIIPILQHGLGFIQNLYVIHYIGNFLDTKETGRK